MADDTDTPRAPARPRPPRTLKARAIGYLARREYARAELRDKLLAAPDSPSRDAVDLLLDELAALGYLSDARFATALVRQKAGAYSRRAIADALKARGVAGEAAGQALAALDGHDEIEDAMALWRRRFGTPPRDEREKARQVRFLQSRGYTAAVALKVLRVAGTPGDDPAT